MENTCRQIATSSQGQEHAHPAHVENVEICRQSRPEALYRMRLVITYRKQYSSKNSDDTHNSLTPRHLELEGSDVLSLGRWRRIK